MDYIVNKVHITDDFSKFKIMLGNRLVSEIRVNKILQSFEKVGYIQAPIIVNEKMEVIDGQGRLEACKRSNQPIAYVVIDGLNINHCINMNINITNWTTEDYVKSYADQGYPDYVRLQNFLKRCRTERNITYNFSILMWTALGTDTTNIIKSLKAGKLKVSEEKVQKAWELLNFFDNFSCVHVNRQNQFFDVLRYLYDIPKVDNFRLIKKLKNANEDVRQRFMHIADAIDVAKIIEDAYNTRTRGNHVYIETLYLQALERISKGFRLSAESRHNALYDQSSLLETSNEKP